LVEITSPKVVDLGKASVKLPGVVISAWLLHPNAEDCSMVGRQIAIAVVVGLFLSCASESFGQDVFFDDFNAENGGVGAVNYNGFAQWSVSDGTVDLIGNGFFDAYPGNGLYVDLDGSSGNAGVLTSVPIALTPGSYVLEFDLGTLSGFAANTMTVSLGGEYSEIFQESDAGLSPTFNLISRPITVASAGSLSLVFDHPGGDDFGLVIDNVRLTLVPEPGSLALLIAGAIAMGLAALRRRRA
jgi:hypothetical protein